MNVGRGRLRFTLIFLGVVCATVGLDALIFGRLVFAPANRTSWDSFPWYNFESEYRRLLHERPVLAPDSDSVLVVGSSIAKYSVQKRELEAALNAERPAGARPVNVELFSHAAMLPTDLSYYVDRIRNLRPHLVVYLTGPADLDLERYAAPYELIGAGTPEVPAFDMPAARKFVANRHPMQILYPGAFAARNRSYLDSEQFLRLSAREFFYSIRFQDEWRESLAFNLTAGVLKAPGEAIVSYLNYQGVLIPEGLWREGHSIAQFSFSLRNYRAAHPGYVNGTERVRLEIQCELKNVPDFHLNIFATNSNGASILETPGPVVYRPEKSGWQDVPLPPVLAALKLSEPDADVIVTIQLSHVRSADATNPRAIIAVREAALLPQPGRVNDFARIAALDRTALARRLTVGRGVRLPANFGLSRLPVDESYVRFAAWEDWRLEAMSPAEYRADFEARIEPLDWRAPEHAAFRQLNQIRVAKYYTNWYDFQSEIQQVQDLTRFARAVTASGESGDDVSGPRLLIVNNPENPLTLAAYENNRWYRGYVEYLRGLADSEDRIYFADHRHDLEANRFLDTHHLTYGGLREMADVYAREIRRALAKPRAN